MPGLEMGARAAAGRPRLVGAASRRAAEVPPGGRSASSPCRATSPSTPRALLSSGRRRPSGAPARGPRRARRASSCPAASRRPCRCCSSPRGCSSPLGKELAAGLPAFGTCAGMILLATSSPTGGPTSGCFGAIDITVRRNGYGRQLESFECDARRRSGLGRRPLQAVFIRAPLVERRSVEPTWRSSRRSSVGPTADASGAVSQPGSSSRRLPPRAHGRPRARARPGAGRARSDPRAQPRDRRVHRMFASDDRRRKDGTTCPATRNGPPPSTARRAVDKARAKLFAKLIRQLEVAAREGGGDMTPTPTCAPCSRRPARLGAHGHHRARHQAGDGRARRGALRAGLLRGVRARRAWPSSWSRLTDNRNRTGSEVRNLFSRSGGSMAEPGAVAWQFERKGVIELPRDARRGQGHGGGHGSRSRGPEPTTATAGWSRPRPTDLAAVRDALEAAGMTVELGRARPWCRPPTVPVTDEGEARQVLRLLETPRRPRRRPERLVQLRHPRRGRWPRRLRLTGSTVHRSARRALATVERVFVLGIDPGLSRCGYGLVQRVAGSRPHGRAPAG